MRIISGRLKGRSLVSFKASHIRPTTDRVKETVFNILQQEIPEARVLDLFSGTGNLAIEAWSRGASFVLAVESHKTSLQIIKKNTELLKIDTNFRVQQLDVFRFLKTYKGDPFQVIFIDPPFTESLSDQCMDAISKSAVAQPGSIVVIESHRHEKMAEKYLSFELLDTRSFGDKYISIFKKVAAHD